MALRTYHEFARSIIDTLEMLGLTYAIGGSFASTAYGEPRTTVDIDISVELPLDRAAQFAQTFESLGYYVFLDSILDAAISSQPFNIIDAESGYKADIFLTGPTQLEQEVLASRQRIVYDEKTGAEAYLYAPEHVIIYKLKYYVAGHMPKHLRDISAMLVVQGQALDLTYIQHWADEIGAIEVWQLLLAEYEQRTGGLQTQD